MSDSTTTNGSEKTAFPRSRIIFYIFAAILFGLVIFYFSSIKKDVKLIQQVEVPWLVLAVIAELTTYLFSAIIYQQLLRLFKPDNNLTLWQLYKASIVALFTDQVIPSGGISGNGFMFSFFTKRKIPVADAFSIIVLQLLTYYSAVEAMIIGVAIISQTVFDLPESFVAILGAGVIGYALFAVLISIIGKKETVIKLGKKVGKIKFLKKYVDGFSKRFSGQTLPAAMSNPWAYFLKHKTIIATVIGCQIAVYLVDAVTISALFRGLGVSFSFFAAFICYVLTRVIALLPISPGSLILYESSMTFFLTQLGAPLGTSITVTLIFRFISFWLPMPLGFLLYRKTTK